MKYQKGKAKIRLSSHNLSIETGRYSNTCKASRCCFSCADCVEDEYHFILVCPVYANCCRKYIEEYIIVRDHRCLNCFNCYEAESFITMSNLGKFIFNSMKLRSSYTITCKYILCETCIYVIMYVTFSWEMLHFLYYM